LQIGLEKISNPYLLTYRQKSLNAGPLKLIEREIIIMFKFDNGKNQPIIEQVESIPPNSNPFHYDLYHMGTQLDKEYTIMYHDFDKNNYIYIIEKSTGKRIQLHLDNLFNSI
jgi:hypothetical protein